MAAIDVIRDPFSGPQEIEGGVGGAVDLHTHMPFDYDGEAFNGSVSENYGDMVKKGTPSGSALYTNRWQTNYGEVGLLVDSPELAADVLSGGCRVG